MKRCEMCGNQFVSKIGEPYCESCSKEFDEMSDNSELNGIVARRGIDWVKEFIENWKLKLVTIMENETEKIACHNCGEKFERKDLFKKKIYEGTDLREESDINYPIALVCEKCFTKI